jgi:hypothetical protein
MVSVRIENENTTYFLDGLGVLVRAVAGGHDELGLRALYMRAPVRYDAVAGIWCVAFAAVPMMV